MGNKVCKSCIHYRQHYSFWDGKIHSIYCGHCLLSATSNKKMHPNTKACDQFEENTTAISDLFASKEYLTKALVEKVLNMDLLPEIKEE